MAPNPRVPHSSNSYIMLSNLNPTLPDVAPPRHVPERLPVGHLNLAARTHSSQRTFEMLILAPGVSAVRVNFALPRVPVVVVDEPRHLVLPVPEMPSHIASCAAFCSWKTMWLSKYVSLWADRRHDREIGLTRRCCRIGHLSLSRR